MNLDFQQIQQADWFLSIPTDIRQLLCLTIVLCQDQKHNDLELWDYSFLVFAVAKGYEGFLKYYLFQVGLIDQTVYQSNKFRIGRALNPDVKPDQRDEQWLYDDVARECSPQVARQIWDAWLECRNRVFHYFPQKPSVLSLSEALARINQIFTAIQILSECGRMDHN